jgi:undecaprenyl-diphosphatase
VLAAVMKHLFNRPRPTIVPHLRVVYSTSFPSGHAMESAIVYLTLGAILMQASSNRLTKLYILGIANLLTTLVGISRVFLGVHYPTDALGGWIVGFTWASVCWLASTTIRRLKSGYRSLAETKRRSRRLSGGRERGAVRREVRPAMKNATVPVPS